jgi:hypothetical protein
MRIPVALVGVAAIAPALFGGSPSLSVGIYHWGGQHTTSLSEGVERIAGLGGRAARVMLSPLYYRDYNIGPSCYPGFSLSTVAREPDVKRAFDNPSIEVMMITAYDGVTFGDCEHHYYVNPWFYTPENKAAVVREYSDFTLYLYQTYQHTHKRFIISDWEGDNTVYCQRAYYYATQAEFRASCDAGYLTSYGNQSPADSIQGLKLWHQARQQGIADGRNRALAEGIGGMRVYFAPEFNITRSLHENGFQSVLYDVLPAVIFDYVSYSSYESINGADPATTLSTDLSTIQDVVGSSAVIIGESGFARSVWGTDAVARSDAVIATALSWGVAYVFQWNLYDMDPKDNFGLFDLDGNETPLGAYFRNTLNSADQPTRRYQLQSN